MTRAKMTTARVQCPRCKELWTTEITLRYAKRHGFGFPQIYHALCLSAVCAERQKALEDRDNERIQGGSQGCE